MKDAGLKHEDAFRTIGEVAGDLDLPQHVLRFWEGRFPQLRPLKRAGGRRFYRPADVAMLRLIRAKLYDEGYTIKGVQRLLRERRGGELAPADNAVSVKSEGDASAASDHMDRVGERSDHSADDGGDSLLEMLRLIEDCERRLRHALREEP